MPRPSRLASPLLLLGLAPASAQEPPAPAPPAAGPLLREVAAAVGLGDVRAYRVALVDADGDGWDDALIHEGGGPPAARGSARLFRNVADPASAGARRFVETTDACGIREGGPNGKPAASVFALVGDVDNDGTPDLFRAAYQEPLDHATAPDTGDRSAILLGARAADGARYRAPGDSGVGADGPVTTSAAAFLDYDRDGNLDLFVGNWYVRYGKGLEAHPDRLYRGDGRGKFADVTVAAALMTRPEPGHADSSRPTYGVAAADLDNDGWPDVLASSYGRQWNRLWRNRGDGTFQDWGPGSGFDGDADRSGVYPEWIRDNPRIGKRETEPPFRANGNSFSAVPADYDDDGDTDVFLCEITHAWAGPSSDLSALLANQGPQATPPWRFVRVTAPFERPRTRQAWNQGDVGAAWGDLDNDGFLDLVLASTAYPDDQRLRIYRQRPDRGFEDATAAFGVDFRDSNQVGIGDYDRDGALDLLVAGNPHDWNGRKTHVAALFRGTPAPGRHWVEVILDGGPGSNRSAFGARVSVTAGGVTRTRAVLSSTGHFGLSPSRTLHFGLGAADRIEKLAIRWPDRAGTVQELRDLPVDRVHEIRG
ncbi:MAG: CRTAC1 family protein [Planctomycetales bacterium]|nr:CRTAC1 family protein [Planctomycetales bacterium]